MVSLCSNSTLQVYTVCKYLFGFVQVQGPISPVDVPPQPPKEQSTEDAIDGDVIEAAGQTSNRQGDGTEKDGRVDTTKRESRVELVTVESVDSVEYRQATQLEREKADDRKEEVAKDEQVAKRNAEAGEPQVVEKPVSAGKPPSGSRTSLVASAEKTRSKESLGSPSGSSLKKTRSKESFGKGSRESLRLSSSVQAGKSSPHSQQHSCSTSNLQAKGSPSRLSPKLQDSLKSASEAYTSTRRSSKEQLTPERERRQKQINQKKSKSSEKNDETPKQLETTKANIVADERSPTSIDDQKMGSVPSNGTADETSPDAKQPANDASSRPNLSRPPETNAEEIQSKEATDEKPLDDDSNGKECKEEGQKDAQSPVKSKPSTNSTQEANASGQQSQSGSHQHLSSADQTSSECPQSGENKEKAETAGSVSSTTAQGEEQEQKTKTLEDSSSANQQQPSTESAKSSVRSSRVKLRSRSSLKEHIVNDSVSEPSRSDPVDKHTGQSS